MNSTLARFAKWVILAGAAALIACTVLAEFGAAWWFADLVSHQRFQYLLAGAVLLPLALLLRARWSGALVAVCIAANVYAIAVVPTAARAVAEPGAQALRVLTANLQWSNRSLGEIAKFVADSDADVVALEEIVPEFYGLIDGLRARYPHVAPANWREGSSEVVVLSRFPLEEPALINAGALRKPIVAATIRRGENRVRLIAVHAPLPTGAVLWRDHRAYFEAVASEAKASPGHVIVLGDFNLTPWSPRFRSAWQEMGLRFAGDYRIWPKTWPAHAHPVSYLPALLAGGLVIDHVLVSDGIGVAALRRGPYIGSDHYPVTADLVLRAPQQGQR